MFDRLSGGGIAIMNILCNQQHGTACIFEDILLKDNMSDLGGGMFL